MPDDAIERARRALAETPHSDGCNFLSRALSDCDCDRPVRATLAFASQQAPEGWVLVPEVCSERWLYRAKKLLGADAAEAQIIWSAMLDAAPSVTLGEVG